MNIFLLVKIAWSSLAQFKLRAILTLLGIFLGSFSLAGVEHASLIMKEKAKREIEKLGSNLLMLSNAQVRFRPSGGARLGQEAKSLKLEEVKYLASLFPQVVKYSPFVKRIMPIKYEKIKINCQLVGVWPSYFEVRKLNLVVGRFLSKQDLQERKMVCLLGDKIASRLFNKEKVLGKTVYFFRAPVKVVGVLAPKGSDIAGNDQDEQVFVPISTYLRRLSNQDWISGAYFSLSSSASQVEVKKEMEIVLSKLHHLESTQKKDFSFLASQDLQKLQKQALDLVNTLGFISSSLSFGVGGIGILSIMILLVRVRRQEIALKRACGARKRDILIQFILESSFLSIIGGSLGVFLVVILLSVGAILGLFPFVLSLQNIFSVFALTFIIGFLAGFYPAYQASKLEILTVLKNIN